MTVEIREVTPSGAMVGQITEDGATGAATCRDPSGGSSYTIPAGTFHCVTVIDLTAATTSCSGVSGGVSYGSDSWPCNITPISGPTTGSPLHFRMACNFGQGNSDSEEL